MAKTSTVSKTATKRWALYSTRKGEFMSKTFSTREAARQVKNARSTVKIYDTMNSVFVR